MTAKTARRSGVHTIRDLDHMRAGTGFDAELNRAIWGTSAENYEKAVAHEAAANQKAHPGQFKGKYAPPGKRPKPTKT
jgi:hypothetical protein